MRKFKRDNFDDIPVLGELGEILERRFTRERVPVPKGQDVVRRGGAGGWIASKLSLVPLVISTIVAAGVAVIAVVALGHGHARRAPMPRRAGSSLRSGGRVIPSPRLSPVQQAITNDINAADNGTIKRDHACWNANRGPTFIHGSPGPALLSRLGVLRRAPLPAAGPTKTLDAAGFTAGSEVYVDDIRVARIAYGRAFVLLPEGNPSARGPIPTRCYTETRAALKSLLLRNVPAADRAGALTSLFEQFVQQRIALRHREGLCFAVVSTGPVRRGAGVNQGCDPVPIWQGGMAGGIGDGDRAGGTIFAAVVPDGTAAVTLEFSASSRDPARTLTSRAINNVVVFKIPPRTAHPDFPTRTIIRAANGQTITARN